MDDILRVCIPPCILSACVLYSPVWVKVDGGEQTLLAFPAIASKLSSIHLIENSEKLRHTQREMLARRCDEKGINLEWGDKVDDIPPCQPS